MEPDLRSARRLPVSTTTHVPCQGAYDRNRVDGRRELSFAEIANYQDYGAAQVFDCVDFGLPTTYPSERKDMQRIFDRALDTCLTMPADAVVIECGGDMLAANIPVFLKRLKRRRSRATVVLAAADPLGAFGGTQMLRDIGLPANLITGPCTDTPASQQRTESLCKTPAMNMLRRES